VELGAHGGASLRFLSKPYDRQQLAQAVHDAIRGRQ
jgi:FixJ family two-component response regulator